MSIQDKFIAPLTLKQQNQLLDIAIELEETCERQHRLLQNREASIIKLSNKYKELRNETV